MVTAKRAQYKPTLFDRHGPAASDYIRALSYGAMVFVLVVAAFALRMGWRWWTIPVGIVAGAAAGSLGLFVANSVGGAWKHLMADGSSTPYVEQYSQQQALVMQGRLDEALESFESVIKEKPDTVEARIRAAELYTREKKNHHRAMELLRDAQRLPTIAVGQDVYVSHRLVDLFTGPLNEPGRALVELRRLIERHPGSAAAEQARKALAELKARYVASGEF
jgi:tetratricopeptide (TPR) repeat protein